jgi:hypothetical protein
MRLLAFADEQPPGDAADLVASNHPDAVVTLGDLEPDWIASLAGLDLPRLGVLDMGAYAGIRGQLRSLRWLGHAGILMRASCGLHVAT